MAGWVARGWWHDADHALAEMRDLIGKEQYHEVGEFPVERAYVWTSCASVENGNPLSGTARWRRADGRADRAALHGLGLVPAPPLGAGRDGGGAAAAGPLRPEGRFGLPEAVMTDNTIEFHTPVRMGDASRTHQVLRSVSEEKTTKLGTGRFWVIDVVYANQDGELVAVESYTGFGYRGGGS